MTSFVVLVLFAVMLLKLVLSKVPFGVASIASIANHRGSPSNGFASAAFRGTPVAFTEIGDGLPGESAAQYISKAF